MKERNYFLDFIKFFASIAIVFIHYQQITGAHFEGSVNFWNGYFNWELLVELFFIISGYLTVKYIDKINNGLKFPQFISKKAARILPMVAVAAFCYEILIFINSKAGGLWFSGESVSFWGTFIECLGVQDGWAFERMYINTPVWYCSVLLLCYVWFYFLTYAANRLKIPVIYLYVIMVFIGCATDEYNYALPFFNSLTARGYYAFFTGVITGSALRNRIPGRRVIIVCLSFIALTLILILKWGMFYVNDFWLVFTVYPSILILSKTELINRIFNKQGRLWEFLGGVSFDLYVWHQVFILLFGILIPISGLNIPYLTESKYMLIFLIIALGFSVISYLYIEKPICRAAGHLINLIPE